MDDAEIRRAIEESDRCEREFKRRNAIRAAQAKQERRDCAHEAEQRAVRKWLARSAGDDETAQTPPLVRMTDVEQQSWDEWLWAHLGNLAETIGDELGERIYDNYRELKKQDGDLSAAIEGLRADLEELRAEVEELRALVSGDGNTRSTVVPMLALKGGRSAA